MVPCAESSAVTSLPVFFLIAFTSAATAVTSCRVTLLTFSSFLRSAAVCLTMLSSFLMMRSSASTVAAAQPQLPAGAAPPATSSRAKRR